MYLFYHYATVCMVNEIFSKSTLAQLLTHLPYSSDGATLIVSYRSELGNLVGDGSDLFHP